MSNTCSARSRKQTKWLSIISGPANHIFLFLLNCILFIVCTRILILVVAFKRKSLQTSRLIQRFIFLKRQLALLIYSYILLWSVLVHIHIWSIMSTLVWLLILYRVCLEVKCRFRLYSTIVCLLKFFVHILYSRILTLLKVLRPLKLLSCYNKLSWLGILLWS